MFLQDGLEVGRGDGGSGEGEREGQTGVGDEDELELGGEGRGEELGEDSLADATEAKKRDGDGTENGSGEHCVVYRESAEYISLQMLFSFKQRVTTSSIKKRKNTTSSISFFFSSSSLQLIYIHFQHPYTPTPR